MGEVAGDRRNIVESHMTKDCPYCGAPFEKEWIKRDYKSCPPCYNKYMQDRDFTKEIHDFRNSELRGLREMVTLSRKGKPRKQPSGFHIIKPYIKNQ